MDKPNNSCYKRVYVGDMAGSTLTVNGKPIVNNIDGDTVVGFEDKLDNQKDTDVFSNEFYNIDRYIRSTLGEYENGKWVTKPAAPHDDYKRCTYTPELVNGELKGVECSNPTGDSISSFDSPLSCSKWVEPDSRLLWIRHDKDCKPVDTTENPNEARSVYKQRDYIRTDYGRYENGKWVTKPTVFIDCVRQDNLTVTLSPVSVGDWEFTYENGVLMAREEGYTDYLEPENNTVIYTV